MGHGGHWSDVLSHGIKLSVLRNHIRRIDHQCRHKHLRRRFGTERWTQHHQFHQLRRRHLANRSSSQTLGSLVAVDRLDFWKLNDFLDDLQKWDLEHKVSTWSSAVSLRMLTPFQQGMLSNFFNKLSPIWLQNREDWRVLFDEILLRTHLDQHALHLVRSLVVP